MIRFPFFLRLLLMMVVAAQLVACSKTVKWEEEVLLNTGQILNVNRSVVYEISGEAGNPFDLAYRPSSKESLTFAWNGKNYLFDLSIFPMVLAISEAGAPVLVAQATSGRWDAVNNYQCTLPFYVQFSYDETRRQWVWPDKLEPWLYNLKANLLRERKPPGEMKRSFSKEEIANQGFLGDPANSAMAKISPIFTGDLCKFKLNAGNK